MLARRRDVLEMEIAELSKQLGYVRERGLDGAFGNLGN